MSQQSSESQGAQIEIENVGGIDRAEVDFAPGVTILTGRNATNRTSLLQAIMSVLGSDTATLKGDSDQGSVELEIDGETFSRKLSRQNSHVELSGNPYLDDANVADLFAFLLEANECRRAVRRGDDLREIIMRPVDTEEIEREIREAERNKERIDERLSKLDDLADEMPKLEEEKQEIQENIQERKDELKIKKKEIAELDKEVAESKKENEELEAKMSEVQEVRADINSIGHDIDSEMDSIEALETEYDEKQAAFENLKSVPADKTDSLDQQMQRMRGQVDELNQTINELQSIIQFNDDFVNQDQQGIIGELEPSTTDDGSVTDDLLASDRHIICWTCGTEVEKEQIESNIEKLRSLRQEKVQRRQSINQEIRELQNEVDELEQQQQRYNELDRELTHIEKELVERKDRVESLQTRKAELEEKKSELESDIEALQKEDHSEILQKQERKNYLQFELDELKTKLEATKEEIQDIQTKLGEREELKDQRQEVIEKLGELRNRVENIQIESIETFNDQMETILDLLDYENLERIWIERTEKTVREGRRKVDRGYFNLHIVRSTESGSIYEDTVDHLSESEREVTGIIFALAGYLVHNVYETVPFMLIDSIEAIDAQRISRLVTYLEGYSDYLVIALLEEDAASLDGDYDQITNI